MTKPLAKKVANRKPTPQQQRFIDYILLSGLTPAEACRMAGYAKGNAKSYDAHKAASVFDVEAAYCTSADGWHC
jgi:hypothetical protein